jgi:hypothetical protein
VLPRPDYLLGGGVLEPGDVGFFDWLDCPDMPPPAPAEPLELPLVPLAELPLVPPLPALFASGLQPDNSAPAKAMAKIAESVCFMGPAPFSAERSNKHAGISRTLRITLSRMQRFVLFTLLASCGAAFAQDDAVVVTAVRDPVKKSYRKMLEGAELFEQRRQHAPEASLRFKLLPRKSGTSMKGVELEVAAESLAIPLKVSPDQTFAIERNRVALKENAQVMPNRRAGTMTWRADVRTPGLPPNSRRLGDLRLECEVGMKAGLISNYPAGFFGWLEELFTKGPAYCQRAAPRYLFFAERPLFSVTLVDGERREVLPVDMLYGGATRDPDWKKDRHCDCEVLFDHAYFVPLGDSTWPDDTLVELEYM